MLITQCSYLIVDYERNNFSISQCLFQEGSQQKLVGIPSANTTTTGSAAPKPAKSSSHTTVISIVLAVVAFVLLVIGAGLLYFWVKRRNRKRRETEERAAAAQEAEEKAERIRLGFDKAEMGTSADHALYEMAGSAVTDLRVEAGGRPYPDWVKEKSALPDMAGMHELTGGRGNLAELGDQKRIVHEMYDPSAAPVELPADMPKELPAFIPSPRFPRGSRSTPSFYSARQTPQERSTPTSPISSQSAWQRSSRPSAPHSPVSIPSAGQTSPYHSNPTSPRQYPVASPVDRRMRRTPQSRSSTPNPNPFAPSLQSGPSSPTDRSTASSPRSGVILNPISPIGDSGSEGHSPVEQRPLVAMLHGLPQPSPLAGESPLRSQHEMRSEVVSRIASQRAESERRRRRNEF